MCGPEFSDLETTIWQTYQPYGLFAFGINRQESQSVVQDFVDQFGITFPVLLDQTGQVYVDYWIDGCSSPFPRDFIIDQDGLVAYLNCEYVPDDMTAVIDSLLGLVDVDPDGGDWGDVANGQMPLLRNAPNPFGASTVMEFDVARDERVMIEIFNVAGVRVRSVLDETLQSGRHRHAWDARDDLGRPVPSGVYFYRLSAVDETRTQRMIVRR